MDLKSDSPKYSDDPLKLIAELKEFLDEQDKKIELETDELYKRIGRRYWKNAEILRAVSERMSRKAR